ncbi:MAG: response regulator [Deltaproteobacteria bacterium]|nr:response regulator [Deltaproteobacteria bacterium]MBW2397739.1 response regulator [Deltaproteobacteria bacterium]
MGDPNDVYKALFELSPDAILIIEGDRFVDCNPAAVKTLRFPNKQALIDRYTPGEGDNVLGAHPAELSPTTQPDGRNSFEKADEMMQIAFERGSHRFEWEHVRADGEVFPVEVMLTVVDREPKHILHVVWREIAERKKLEQDLRLAQRLESVGRLAGGIAHDFNNILVVILSHAALLQRDLRAAGLPELAEQASEIRAASDRAAALTRQLLTFSRGHPTRPRPTDLVELLGSLGSMLSRLIGEDIDFVLDLPPGPVTVQADQSQIEQLVVNLAANARDAMPSGGALRVELSRHAHGKSDVLPRLESGSYAAIRVIDSGDGMTPEQLERAFDPFYTTKPPGSGSGLGLATVHSIAEQCGGGATIESALAEGTTVSVLLPLCSAEPVSTEPPPPASEALEGSETILLAEDEDAIRTLMCNALEQCGYHVLRAADGTAAMEIAQSYDSKIDLVITDVVMPRLSGPDFVQQLQEIRPGTKVIFMSGYAQDGTVTGATVDASAEILEKPFSPDVLLSSVRKLLDRT